MTQFITLFGIDFIRSGLMCDRHEGTIDVFLDNSVSVEIVRWGRTGAPGTYACELFVMIPKDVTEVFAFQFSDMGVIMAVVDDFGNLVPIISRAMRVQLQYSIDREWPRPHPSSLESEREHVAPWIPGGKP